MSSHGSIAESSGERSKSRLKRTAVFLQNACLQHRYIRSKDLSNIVERPERLRAVNVGLSAAIARLQDLFLPEASASPSSGAKGKADSADLVDIMNKLKIDSGSSTEAHLPVEIVQSSASANILTHPAVKYIHGDIERDVYLENLTTWAKESHDNISKGESEIPQGYSQGDLYLCPGSISAIEGAVGTVCEAVDRVISSTREPESPSTIHRSFVGIRPPGHHCGEDNPSGFCFLNNVAIAAAHAHLQHGIKRVVIFDIDLHHGNGTQSIVWQINEETYRQVLESEGGAPTEKTGPELYYGSIHDILSYPCEDGKLELVQAASVSIHKSHGQSIENVHLQTYTSEEHFWNVLYKEQYSKLLIKAQEFLDHTGGPGDDVLIFISCGMDACEHEYESMSRHNRKVPTSFYHRFARDACLLSDKYAKGRVISVLEGGYSDRALMSGAMAHLSGLVDVPAGVKVDEDWWKIENLVQLESATKKRRGRPSLPGAGTVEPWLERTLEIFTPLDITASLATASAPRVSAPVPPSSRTLRDRAKAKNPSPSKTDIKPISSASPASSRGPKARSRAKVESASTRLPMSRDPGPPSNGSSPLSSASSTEDEAPAPKKIPKVILRLGKPPGMGP